MLRCGICFILVLLFINYGDSYISPANNGYHLVLADKYSQLLDEYSAGTGELLQRLNNAILVNPRDVKGYNNTLYVTGNHYAISMYDQTTLEYKGIFLNFTNATQTLRFFNNNTKLGVVLYDEYEEITSLNIYEFPSKILNGTINCIQQCYDLIENRINGKLLVATSVGVEQYRFNAGSWSLEGNYIVLSPQGYLTRGMLQWAGNQLYVGDTNTNRILRYDPGPATATSAGVFAGKPNSTWVLMGFDFYSGSTSQLAVVGYNDDGNYPSFLYRFNKTASTWTIIATSDLSQMALIGAPENVYFDDTGKLLVSDYSWITRWNATNGTFLGQIIHQLGIIDVEGITVDPNDPEFVYVATGNRVVRVDRTTNQAVDVFIPRVLSHKPDGGDAFAGRMQWYNNTLWMSAYEYLLGFNYSGHEVKRTWLPNEKVVQDFKINPVTSKLYACANSFGELYEWDMNSPNVILRPVPGLKKGSYIAFSANGTVVYLCSDANCKGVTAYSTLTWSAIRNSSAVTTYGTDIEVGPDGNVYLQADEGVWVLDGNTLVSYGKMTEPIGANNYRQIYFPGDTVFALASYPPSPSPSVTPSRSPPPSISPTSSITPSTSATSSVTPSISATPSTTPSISATPTRTPSATASPSTSATPSQSATPSVTPSGSVSPSSTPSVSPSIAPTPSPTASPSSSPIPPSNTPSPDPTESNKTSFSAAAVGAGVGVGGVLLCAGLVGFFAYKRRSKKNGNDQENAADEFPMGIVPSLSAEEVVQNMFNKFWEINFDDLEIGSEVGRGAFGAVFKGEWRNSYCVVKQLQQITNIHDSVAAFLKEANTVKMLRNHRNVCTIFGVCTNPEKPICIVMEYCNGGNLQSALADKKIIPTLPNLIRIFKDITSGMAHVHLEGIAHCDLACRNVLVSFEGNGEFAIKISDFGLARVLPEEGFIKTSQQDLFPIRWSAPELLQDNFLSRPCDVWSFGVVMWEIIAGTMPYRNLNNSEVIDYVCKQRLVLEEPTAIVVGQIPKTLYNIMRRCWAQPDQRPAFEYLNREFKELEKDTLREVVPTKDATPLPSENNNNDKEYDNMARSKHNRYDKTPTSGSTNNTSNADDPNLAYGNKYRD